MNAEQAVREHRGRPWKLTDPSNAGHCAQDILDWHVKMVELCIDWYTEEHGFEPNLPLRPSCQTGDWTPSAVMLDHAEGDLNTVKSMITNMRQNPYMRYQWGGMGYLIYGTPWNEIPERFKPYLRTRIVDSIRPD